MQRFIRFVTPMRDEDSRCSAGIFSINWQAVYRNDWRGEALLQERSWFNENLDAPERLMLRRRGRGNRSGICWFRPEATECIRRARYMAWILTDLGMPISELQTTNPGVELWSDAHQVVALPNL